jgi:FixJ family two-component response regulator
MPIFVIQDDLFFAARVDAVGRRLGLAVEPISPQFAEAGSFKPDSVVIMQVTLNSSRQLHLLEQLRKKDPPPAVVAVAGHLETDLRRRARALGALVASHSGMERTIARAAGIAR